MALRPQAFGFVQSAAGDIGSVRRAVNDNINRRTAVSAKMTLDRITTHGIVIHKNLRLACYAQVRKRHRYKGDKGSPRLALAILAVTHIDRDGRSRQFVGHIAAQAAACGAHALTPGNLAVCTGNPAPSVDKVTLRLSGGVDPKNDELGTLLPGFPRMNHARGDFL